MARWVLLCPYCHQEFTYSRVDVEHNTMKDVFLAEFKPEFPTGGLPIVCPHCHAESIYQRVQLTYRQND